MNNAIEEKKVLANDSNIEDNNLHELNDSDLEDVDVAELEITHKNKVYTYTSEIGYLRNRYSNFGEWEIDMTKDLQKKFTVFTTSQTGITMSATI